MKEIQACYSKIFNAHGVNLLGSEEIILPFIAKGVNIEVYVGSSHRYPVFYAELRDKNSLSQEKSTAEIYTEIIAYQCFQVEDEIAEALENGSGEAFKFISETAKEFHSQLSIAADFIAGFIGLRLHKSFVRTLISEQSYVLPNLKSNKIILEGKIRPFSVIPVIDWDISEGNKIIFPKLQKAWSLESAAEILAWLLRAWNAKDPILKFVSLFIPLELVVKKNKNTQIAPCEKDIWENQRKEILKIVQVATLDNEELIKFLKGLQKPSPSISMGFEKLATDSKLPGWEHDIVAFNKFNRMRNLLVHAGKNVESKISVTENEVRTLEDLTARYVSYALYGDANIYQLLGSNPTLQ